MTWKDKTAAAFFLVAVLASFGTIGYIVIQTRAERPARADTSPAARDRTLVRGIVLDYGRAVQRDDPESACVVLGGDAFEAFDCRFGRTDVPAGLELPEGRDLTVGEVTVEGDQAFVQLRGGATPQPVRLERTGRRWRIIRVGVPQPARE